MDTIVIPKKTLILDIETTGLPPKGAEYEVDYMSFPYIVSLAYKINGEETKEFIINQEGRHIPDEATAIHGITDEMASASRFTLAEVLKMMVDDAKDTELTVGHNIFFDSSTIKANVLRMIQEGKATFDFYDRLCIPLHKDRRVDTMKKTIKFCALNGKWPKLTELHEKLFGESFAAHSAGEDVDATHRCYIKLVELGII